MAVRAPKPAAPAAAAAAAARRQSVAPTAGATTAGATQATDKNYRDFAETLTSEFQAAGDQSQGMHDDPRNAYRGRKNYVLFIEIIMAVCVIALIVGTVVMFVVGTNTGTITLKPEVDGPEHTPDQAAATTPNTTNNNPAPLGGEDYEEEVT